MRLEDFKIGSHFQVNDGLWICTDIGSMVITVIRLDKADVVETSPYGSITRTVDVRREPELLCGPPYMLQEHVFDEYDREDCEPVIDQSRWPVTDA